MGAHKAPAVIVDLEVNLKLLDMVQNNDASSDKELHVVMHRRMPVFESFQNEVRRQIDQCRFALLLSSNAGNLLAPAHTATAVLNPFIVGSATSIIPNVYAPLPTQEVTDQTARHSQEWIRRIQSQPRSLDMGMRRLLAATSSRIDAMDGFVDAVICWENLFGTSEGESTFRVSGTMAILLEPDSMTARKECAREIRELYRARSFLVHGSKELDSSTALANRDRAVELALTAFRAVYDDDHLLQAEDSNMRSRLVLLGF
jgi:hypothetical protein